MILNLLIRFGIYFELYFISTFDQSRLNGNSIRVVYHFTSTYLSELLFSK